MALTDAQYAAFIDRLIACREAEDAAKEDTKAVYAELADAGEDKTVAGLVVRQRRMTAKDRVKAELRDAAAEDGHSRYLRGKASHVRAREALPEHDAETGEIIDTTSSTAAQMDAPGQPIAKRGLTSVSVNGEVQGQEGETTLPAGTQAPPVEANPSPDCPAGEEAGEAQPGETSHASPAVIQAETPNEAPMVVDGDSAEERRLPQASLSTFHPAGTTDEERDGADHQPAASNSEPAGSLPAADRSGGHRAPSSSLEAVSAPVTLDRTRPNPWCQDPEDCGVVASWEHMCGVCLRLRAERQAAEAVQ